MPVVVVGDVRVLSGRRRELEELLAATQRAARSEPGCAEYAFAEVVGDPGHLVLVGEWRDGAALESHYRSDAYKAYQAAIGDFLARPSSVRIHHVRDTIRPEDSAPMDPRRAD